MDAGSTESSGDLPSSHELLSKQQQQKVQQQQSETDTREGLPTPASPPDETRPNAPPSSARGSEASSLNELTSSMQEQSDVAALTTGSKKEGLPTSVGPPPNESPRSSPPPQQQQHQKLQQRPLGTTTPADSPQIVSTKGTETREGFPILVPPESSPPEQRRKQQQPQSELAASATCLETTSPSAAPPVQRQQQQLRRQHVDLGTSSETASRLESETGEGMAPPTGRPPRSSPSMHQEDQQQPDPAVLNVCLETASPEETRRPMVAPPPNKSSRSPPPVQLKETQKPISPLSPGESPKLSLPVEQEPLDPAVDQQTESPKKAQTPIPILAPPSDKSLQLSPPMQREEQRPLGPAAQAVGLGTTSLKETQTPAPPPNGSPRMSPPLCSEEALPLPKPRPQLPDPAALTADLETASPKGVETKSEPSPNGLPSSSTPLLQPKYHKLEPVETTVHPVDMTQPKPASMQELTTVQPVVNGLQLKTNTKQLSFTYALVPMTDYINPVKNKVLILDDKGVQADHVVVHRLKPSQKLAEVVAEHRQHNLTKAVVIVNTEDSLILGSEYLEEYKGSNYPVLIVSNSNGQQIFKLLDEEEEDVHCNVMAESRVDAFPHYSDFLHHHQQLGHSEVVTEQPRVGIAKAPQEKKATGWIARWKGSGSTMSSIKQEIMTHMFSGPGGTQVRLSGDSGRFCMVMSAFNVYECSYKGKADKSQVREAMQKINKHLESIFYEDFPFYLILAYRMYIRMTMYECDERQSFTLACINMMEDCSSYHRISKCLQTFLSLEDFSIMFPNGNFSSFYLLQQSCIEFCKVSFITHNKKSPPNELHKKFICNTMVWVSLSLKIGSHRQAVTNSEEIWREQLISRSSLLTLNHDQINDLKIGLSFEEIIQLPQKLRLSTNMISDMLVPSPTTVRYFTHLTYFFKELNMNLTSEDMLIVLTCLTRQYHIYLWSGRGLYKHFSHKGTLASTLTEGLDLLNQVSRSWTDRNITDSTLNSTMKGELLKWLMLLMQLIDITKDDAHTHLKLFVRGRRVAKEFQKEIIDHVVKVTKQNFSQLSIHQFFPLYKAFKIWSPTLLKDYLKQYNVPRDVIICDSTWEVFFGGIINRFSGAYCHCFISDFLQSVAAKYQESQRATDFILDLLKLRVSSLFAIDPGEEQGQTTMMVSGEDVHKDFKRFLQNFIKRNSLKHPLLEKMSNIMGSITSERYEFQALVLDVLKKEVVPELKALQVSSIDIRKCVTELCQNLDWLTVISPKQGFCWGVVAGCCSKVPVRKESLKCVQDYTHIILRLCSIYGAYCNSQGIVVEEGGQIKQGLPKSVQHNEDIITYFEWIRQLQAVVVHWQERAQKNELNYDEIMEYANIQGSIVSISNVMRTSSSIFELQHQKDSYLWHFEQLNMLLLRYIPGKPELKWCTTTSLLAENGVSFPPEIADTITKYIKFPGDSKEVVGGLLSNVMRVDVKGQFKPGQPISLKLSKRLGLNHLATLVDCLYEFLKPHLSQMEMLVFFRLQRSTMFKKYQKLYLEKELEASVTMQLSEAEEEPEKKMNVSILVRSLNRTKELLIKLTEGNATYNEIIAEGQLDLENLNIKYEFDVLNEFIRQMKYTPKSEVGLKGVRCILELLQLQGPIMKICEVCEQYSLNDCLQDPSLKKLMDLAKDLHSENSRQELTLNEAIQKMEKVRNLLFGNVSEGIGIQCLKLFDKVADSADFYQFIKDKGFDEAQGQEVFTQQYQLITAQLQHEEYDEQVLNHLFAAYEFMLPLMNVNQNFRSLMDAVVKLDTSNGLKELQTVNSNITLIKLWFSRAEGDTLQNVDNELKCISETGQFVFTLLSGASGITVSMTLEYTPSSVSTAESKGEMTKRTKQSWTREQINDFVRKLGFFDIKREGRDQIKPFLHINEVAKKLLELHAHLRDLGHPDYLKAEKSFFLHCQICSENADAEVLKTESKLTSWARCVTELRSLHKWLLFFSVPKQLLLYQLIQQFSKDREEEVTERLMQDIMFLVKNVPTARQKLWSNIMLCLPHWYGMISEDSTAMGIVGGFLGDLLQHHALPQRSTQIIQQTCPTQFPGITNTNQLLHSAPKYQQSQLVRLIISIYDGVPESFEVFHCRFSTTQKELGLFLERVEKQPLRYLILEVNKLPFRLQEYLMKCYLKIEQRARKYQADGENILSSECNATPATEDSRPVTTITPTIHFVETSSSVLRELPWILVMEHKEAGPNIQFAEAKRKCKEAVRNFADIQLVCGRAGDGKTHYINQQLKQSSHSVTIAVNEAFTPVSAIKILRTLPPSQRNCAIFFNFTMLPPGESVNENEKRNYKELMNVIGWFFFDLILLSYVEDPVTGLSVSIPGGMDWKIFVEVPSQISSDSSEAFLAQFIEEIPALGMLGVPHLIDPSTPYTVDEDVQLVCKYLKAYWIFKEEPKSKGINKLYSEIQREKVKFSTDPDIPDAECYQLFIKSWPIFAEQPKMIQKLFIKYLKRRCAFLDQLPAFNFNTGFGEYYMDPDTGKRVASDTQELGSTLMSTMLKEVIDFCNPDIKENWTLKAHQQLIYDFKDGGGSFGLLSLQPDHLSRQDKTKFEKIRISIPSVRKLCSREILDEYLSRALNIELDDNKHLPLIDESKYVLTLDYTIKMLNIHERYECGVPVIIEGETGVGKTALVEMLSKLWNQSLLIQWKRKKDQILDYMRQKLGNLDETVDHYMKSLHCVEDFAETSPVNWDDLVTLCQLPDSTSTSGMLYTTLRSHLLPMQDYAVISLLTIKENQVSLKELFSRCKTENTAETTASLLQAVMVSEVKSTFYKINVHSALTPDQIWCHLQPAIEQANFLREAYKHAKDKPTSLHAPSVTVFLDEVNTSSCLGLFREIIVDHTFHGVPIPDNIFVIAACNPHRGNSLAAHGQFSESSLGATTNESWTRSTYYVRQLHPTLDLLKWDYGSLDKHQEKEYIDAKMKMLNQEMETVEISSLTQLIVKSQELMREYAREQLSQTTSDKAYRSCVSQRDIQRVFTFFEWFQNLYEKVEQHGEVANYSRRAILVSLGIVYYMRLNTKYREKFRNFIDKSRYGRDISFSRAFEEELEWFIKEIELPVGIAQTQALKENLFANVVCTATHTPLIIIGAPGSSKTLSFNLTIANLKGQESRKPVFRKTPIFHSLDPHFYQCSRQTTSNEIDTVFSRAINRQRSYELSSLPIYCVVFMDEAGLPEESHESLKVLHYHLDRQEVSFVAITNHMLDAAKSNRAVCLFRPEALEDDLKTLTQGCLSSKLDSPPQEDLNLVVNCCPAFSQLMKKRIYSHFFGLRDFIHFVNYLRRRRARGLIQQLVMEALERNFNGHDYSNEVAESFMKAMGCQYSLVQKRNILAVLKDSLGDQPLPGGQDISENEVRYKLIIDPSEDDSLIRLLFSLGVLDRQNTRMYVCSDFPGDSHIQKINTIAAIRHSATEGHTVIMSQTDDIHESFYDLFNQRFRRIDDQKHGPRYYTNIAIGAHLKPCQVNPKFQCVVVMKKSEIEHTPAPFLNRFEKYCITHETLLETALTRLPPCLKRVVLAAQQKVEDFVKRISPDGLYGLKQDTVNSLILSLLPPVDFDFHCEEQSLMDSTESIKLYMLKLLVQYARSCCGLHIPFIPPKELQSDADEVFKIAVCNPEFDGIMKNLEHQQASDAVHEAVNMLHSAPEPPEAPEPKYIQISEAGSLVLMLLQQWLVRHLTKRIMQLMTLEALTKHRSNIPCSYLESYLEHQAHFSLSGLIDRYLKGLTSKWEAKFPTSKVLCFTRSTPLIHQLPAQYPSHALEQQSNDDIKQTLKSLVHEDVDKLMVCKLSNIPSQSHVLELLHSFVHSETHEVLLLIVNMQEIRQQVINHIRIMIEEEEAMLLNEDRKQKLFLLLLHFPPSKFANACYPSLFLRGWDHCYMDTVAHGTATGVIDIRSWFWNCCFPPNTLPPPYTDPLILTLKEILKNEAIPILASRVFFGLVHNGYFNTSMSGSKRTKILKTLLFDKDVGNVLCERFRSYWEPNVMSEYLEKAVAFTKSQDSTLNITDSVHTTFKSLFFDFLVYMLSRINEDCNIDILFQTSCTRSIHSLFLDIVQVFKIPKLSELKVRSAHLQLGKKASYLPQFPFFKMVSAEMERLVEDSHQEVNTKTNILEDLESNGVDHTITLSDQQSQDELKRTIVEKFKALVKSDEKSFLAHSLKALVATPAIWDCYLKDFIAHTLHLDGSEGISHNILHTFFEQLCKDKTMFERITQLYIYITVNQLELAKMATLLRPLDCIQYVSVLSPSSLSPLTTSSSVELVDEVQKRKYPLQSSEHLSDFVVIHLFSGLVGAAFGQNFPSSLNVISNTEQMLTWYKAYRNMMCLPSLKQHVYSALHPAKPTMAVVEARLNVMHTVFLILRSFSDSAQTEPPEALLVDLQKIFQTLFNAFFNENMKVKNGCPRLSNVSELAVKIIKSIGSSQKSKEKHDNNKIRLLMEGLFSHFFSTDRPDYHEEDTKWFLQLANQQDHWFVSNKVTGGTSETNLCDTLQDGKTSTATLTMKILKGVISMCTFKMYLSRLLGECDSKNEDPAMCGPLLLHQFHPRLQVGQMLMSRGALGDPGPYIPTFYQECPAISPEQASLGRRMQQPLAHLYFLTVLEHVLEEPKSLADVVKAGRELSYLVNLRPSDLAQHALLQIEFQAVLQVIAKLLAELLSEEPKEGQFIDLNNNINAINQLFGDVTTGGGKVGGHGMVVALHLLKAFKSSRKFIELMTTKFDTCKDIMCLVPVQKRLQEHGESIVHMLPFMLPIERDDALGEFYKRVKEAMEKIHELNQEGTEELKEIAAECNTPQRISGGLQSVCKQVNNHCNFKMMMWLVIFYEFYDRGIQSPTLWHVISSEEFSELTQLKKSEITLFHCFLETEFMLCQPEDPNALRIDENILELHHGQVRRKQPQGKTKKVDPLHELFVSSDPNEIDQSDRDLKYALANMVAVVLGCEPESNHLWYHLFDQEPLWNTYLTGFMYSSKIKKEGLLYDCGVELTPDGQFGRPEYLKHAGRGTYTLHSLYLLLWANFGAFCMALLVLPDAERAIHGPLISEWLSVRHYCISQLRTVWMHIRNNLMISDEERSFLIMRCMKTFYEVMNSDGSNPDTHRGVFTSIEELDSYEKLWHTHIYKPSQEEIRKKFIQYSNLMQDVCFMELRNLELHYPYYPTEQDFTHSVLSSGDVVCEDIALLSRFSLQWRRLQAGGELLPDLVEFYQWLHMDLAHQVTYDRACKISIGKVISHISRKYPRKRGRHLEDLFTKIKDGYNKYVELIGQAIGAGACAAVRQGNKMYTIHDNIPLLHFLSDGEEEEGNDWLFIVIADIITAHNDMLDLSQQVACQPFLQLLPESQSTAYPREITSANCIIPPLKIVHGVNKLVQLIRSRHRNILHTKSSFSPITMSLTSNPSPSHSYPLFYLQELQEDIVISFLAGKPSIIEVSTLRTPFRFKVSVPSALKHKTDIISSHELTVIRDRLPDELKREMDTEFWKRLKFEFHPADYHVLLATTTGLKNATGHLVKSVIDDELKDLNQRQTLSDFLLSLYDGLNLFKDALSEIGMKTLTENQIVCLSELPLVNLYHCLRVFATWMEQGMYDFCALPYTLKAHIHPTDLSVLKAIPDKWEGTKSELMSEVESLNSQLSHSEAHITGQDAVQSETPITTYLRNIQFINDEERLPHHIPDSVLIQHFVELRITLRGIMREVQQRLDEETREKEAAEREPNIWNEVVVDIWEKWLPHISYTGDSEFLYDAAEGRYLFQEDYESEGEGDLMASGDEEEDIGREREQNMNEENGSSVISDEGASVANGAEDFTSEQVAEFLSDVGLGQYAKSFVDQGVDGGTLLEAKDPELMSVGVDSRLHQVKIITLFKRLDTGVSPTSMTVDDVVDFLTHQKLDQFVDAFRENGIDGDILKAILSRETEKVKGEEMSVTDKILEELGVKSGMQMAGIRRKLKKISLH